MAAPVEVLELTADQERFVTLVCIAASQPRTTFEEMSAHKKAFVEASKAFTMIAGAGVTSLNIFGLTIAYMSKRVLHANDGSMTASQAPSPSPSDKLQPVGLAHQWMLAATFFCFLYTCCSAAVAHATVHRPGLLKLLKLMIYFELLLVSAICGLHYYMLTEDPEFLYWFWLPVLAFIAMVVGVVQLLHDPNPNPGEV